MTPPRRCSTCRHFQPAPLWRKGWCRNPLLYSAHQNHLVDERDLDCARAFGDYWDAPESDPGETRVEVGVAGLPPEPPAPAQPMQLPSRPWSGARQPARTVRVRDRMDLIRFAAPAVLVTLAVLVYLSWLSLLGQSRAATTTPVATTIAAAPAPATTTASPAPRPPTSVPTVRPTAAATPTAVALGATPVATPTGLHVGGTATVETGSSDGLRLRREPGSGGTPIRTIKNGERLALLEGPRDADGVTWWKVQFGNDQGWVAAPYIKPTT